MKEIEIRNFESQVNSGDHPTLSGHLSNDGETLHVSIDRDINTGFVREYQLWYTIFDHERRTQAYEYLGNDNIQLPGEEADPEFDLSPVLEIFVKRPAQITSDTIDIEIYTYEANVETAYGTKRLSVPYSITAFDEIGHPDSTDGVYLMKVQDYALYGAAVPYMIGDVVYDSDSSALYRALADNTGTPVTDTDFWEALTTEMKLEMALLPSEDDISDMVINSYVLNTRNVKKSYVLPLLSRTSFKKHDDIEAVKAVQRVTALRHSTLVYIESFDPIRAGYVLSVIPVEVNSFFGGDDDSGKSQTTTNFTL